LPGNRIAQQMTTGQLQLDYKKEKWFSLETKLWTSVGGDLPQARQDIGLPYDFHRDVGFWLLGGSERISADPTKWLSAWLRAEYELDNERMNATYVVPKGDGLNHATLLTPAPGTTGLPSWAQGRYSTIPPIGNFGLSAYALATPIEDISLSLGGRWDEHSVYGSNFSYSAGAVGTLPKVGYLKLLSGRSFKAPTPQQLFWQPIGNADFAGNPSLKAEAATTHELVLGRRQLSIFDIQATGFVSFIDNRALYIARDGFFQAQAVSSSTSEGAELEISIPKLTLVNNQYLITASVSGSYQNTNLQLSEVLQSLLTEQNVLYPTFKGVALASLEMRPIYAALMARAYLASSRLDSQVNIQVRGGEIVTLGPRYQLDLGLQTTGFESFENAFLKGLKVQFTIRNVLDDRRPYPGYNGFEVPREPRTFEIYLSETPI
jgi:hypothetical protein